MTYIIMCTVKGPLLTNWVTLQRYSQNITGNIVFWFKLSRCSSQLSIIIGLGNAMAPNRRQVFAWWHNASKQTGISLLWHPVCNLLAEAWCKIRSVVGIFLRATSRFYLEHVFRAIDPIYKGKIQCHCHSGNIMPGKYIISYIVYLINQNNMFTLNYLMSSVTQPSIELVMISNHLTSHYQYSI